MHPGLPELVAGHPGKSGAYVLEKGEESLLARAWLADNAARSIDVQYFIWSTDNIGILAAEALLRAAERGVWVRVLVDDLLVDAPTADLLALSAHPQIDIRIYNPRHSVGVSPWRRMLNLITGFRVANLRMHDKTVIVDGQVAITGGRNMADEYYDYDHAYNFRDRDILLIGPVAGDMGASFQRFWDSEYSVPVETLLSKELSRLTRADIDRSCAGLHRYARDRDNFAEEVRWAILDIPERFSAFLEDLVWDDIVFVSDLPGKNPGTDGLGGGGRTTGRLMDALSRATRRVTIQSPYLVMPEGAMELFENLIKRGVEVWISTNSLSSTDNLMAFSGYRRQQKKLLEMGINIREFRPDPAVKKDLIDRYRKLERHSPVFAIHAKTMVIDGKTLFIGTFNLDPRSANLNTEVGVLITNPGLAGQVEGSIRRDMGPGNSWDPAVDKMDSLASQKKRFRLWFWKLMPITPLL